MTDPSNGYDAIARDFAAIRERGNVGAAVVRAWAASIRPGGVVLDAGCGAGVPVSQVLTDAGLAVHALDASPALLARYRERFPAAITQCAAVETSDFFDRAFDGIIAWGVVFLLSAEAQREVIRRMGRHTVSGGRVLFTAPSQRTEWDDVLTGRASRSLGHAEYARLIKKAGFVLEPSQVDEGQNHYYSVVKA